MGDEQDSWLKPFGLAAGKLAQEVFNVGKAVVEAGVKEVKDGFNKAKEFAEDKIDKGEKAIKSVVSPSAPAPKSASGGGSSGGGSSSTSSLGGSVGRGGQNNPGRVKGIQRGLIISDDGKCGPGTMKAIESFTITGPGFLQNTGVTMRVVDDALNQFFFQTASDSQGRISVSTASICQRAVDVHFSELTAGVMPMIGRETSLATQLPPRGPKGGSPPEKSDDDPDPGDPNPARAQASPVTTEEILD